MRRSLSILVFLIVLAFGAYLSYRSDRIVEFNDQTVALLESADAPFPPLAVDLSPYFDGELVDVAGFEAAIAASEATNRDCATRLVALSNPAGDTGQAFMEGALDYVNANVELLTAYKRALGYIATHNPAQESADIEAVDGILVPAFGITEAATARLAALQEAMAQKHDFELKENGK